MVESNRFLTSGGQFFIEDVKHLKKGHVLVRLDSVGNHLPRFAGAFLTPDVQSDFHDYL